MKKIKNKFIILIIISLIIVIFLWIYKSYFFEMQNRNSFAVLVEWKWFVNDKSLQINEKNKLEVWDIVKTVWVHSLLVIEWWDWSITRIGWDSDIKISELFVDNNLLKINLSFELLSWKSWSNVVNFMWEWSYFKESFRDIEAGVRWTIFNIDLDKDYISVTNHKLLLVKNIDQKIFEINEGNPFSLKTFSFIDLEEFIKNIKDKSFEELNKKFDREYFKALSIKLSEKLDYFDSLSEINIKELSKEKKDALYNKLLTKYQELNFISPDNYELFSKKLEYKKVLIELAPENDKKSLINNTLYDFKESIKTNNYWNIESIISIFEDNLDTVKWFKVDFNDYFDVNMIPEEFKEIFINNYKLFENIFGSNLVAKIPNINIDDLKLINNNVQSKINKQLDNNLSLFMKIFNFIKSFFN